MCRGGGRRYRGSRINRTTSGIGRMRSCHRRWSCRSRRRRFGGSRTAGGRQRPLDALLRLHIDCIGNFLAARESDVDIPSSCGSALQHNFARGIRMHHQCARVRNHFDAWRRVGAYIPDGISLAGVDCHWNSAGFRGHDLAPRQHKESECRHRQGRQFSAAAHFLLNRFDHRPIPPHYGTSIVFEFAPVNNGLSSGAPEKPASLAPCA